MPRRGEGIATRYNDLRAGSLPPPAPSTSTRSAVLFELSLGLSAWKQHGTSRWALRCNPSSGNLHPTEGYVCVAPALAGTRGRRPSLREPRSLPSSTARVGCPHAALRTARAAAAFPSALTSIHWREAWKYGDARLPLLPARCRPCRRRHCLCRGGPDGLVRCVVVAAIGDDALAGLLRRRSRRGLRRRGARSSRRACSWIGTEDAEPRSGAAAAKAPRRPRGKGAPAASARNHRDWPDIDAASTPPATKPDTPESAPGRPAPLPPPVPPALDLCRGQDLPPAPQRDGLRRRDRDRLRRPSSHARCCGCRAGRGRRHGTPGTSRPLSISPSSCTAWTDSNRASTCCCATRPQAATNCARPCAPTGCGRKVGPEHLPLYLLLPARLARRRRGRFQLPPGHRRRFLLFPRHAGAHGRRGAANPGAYRLAVTGNAA
ncbi:MAG: hypothetical protein MZV65_44190 [Chromatiales bacterium]|nr:hypothetical protein [Chromatiales bacterium]